MAIPQSAQEVDSDDSDDEGHIFSSEDDSADEEFDTKKGRKNIPLL